MGKIFIKADRNAVSKWLRSDFIVILVGIIALAIASCINPNLSTLSDIGRLVWAIVMIAIIIYLLTLGFPGVEIDTEEKTIRRALYAIKFPVTHYKRLDTLSEWATPPKTSLSVITTDGKRKSFMIKTTGVITSELVDQLGLTMLVNRSSHEKLAYYHEREDQN